jgi:hypothetical protein
MDQVAGGLLDFSSPGPTFTFSITQPNNLVGISQTTNSVGNNTVINIGAVGSIPSSAISG